MPSDDHTILAIFTTDLTADDDKTPPPLTTSSDQILTRAGGLLSPHSPAAGPCGSLDIPSSPTLTTTDDGASIITVPPSPTLSSRSSVHFTSSLALRDNNLQLRSPSHLLSPGDGRNTHQRKGSNATFATTINGTTEAYHSPQHWQDEELHYVKSNATSVTTHVGSRSASRAKRDTVDSDTAAAISVRPQLKKGAGPQEPAELDTDTDPTPFRIHSNDLAIMLDPKILDTLEDMGGIEDLDGFGTTADMGLSGASFTRS
ncbi:hypothetical protein B0H13DRAFT_2200138, partial [Mycena leptocephala]